VTLPPNFASIWPGSLTLLDGVLDGLTPGQALEQVPAGELPRTDAEIRIWDQISTGQIPVPMGDLEVPEMHEAEERCPEHIQDPSEFEREISRQVYSYHDIADMLAQARQEARDYSEAVETRENRTGALVKALAGRQWDASRTYRAPVFRPMPEAPKVRVTREQWEAIDAMDADLLAQTMGLARVRGGIECPLHKGDHEAKVYRSRRGAMHWQCFRSDQGGGALELFSALVRGGLPTEREQRRAVAAEMVARGLV
jgi:hypothetical protein